MLLTFVIDRYEPSTRKTVRSSLAVCICPMTTCGRIFVSRLTCPATVIEWRPVSADHFAKDPSGLHSRSSLRGFGLPEVVTPPCQHRNTAPSRAGVSSQYFEEYEARVGWWTSAAHPFVPATGRVRYQ